MTNDTQQLPPGGTAEERPTEAPIERKLSELYYEGERQFHYSSEYHSIHVVASREVDKSMTAQLLRKLADWLGSAPDPDSDQPRDPWVQSNRPPF